MHLSYRRDVRLVRGTVVVGHEGVELQGVELKASVVDVLDILHGVFVHGQQGGGLEDGKRENIKRNKSFRSFSKIDITTCTVYGTQHLPTLSRTDPSVTAV